MDIVVADDVAGGDEIVLIRVGLNVKSAVGEVVHLTVFHNEAVAAVCSETEVTCEV